jgi:hypothetical protein
MHPLLQIDQPGSLFCIPMVLWRRHNELYYELYNEKITQSKQGLRYKYDSLSHGRVPGNFNRRYTIRDHFRDRHSEDKVVSEEESELSKVWFVPYQSATDSPSDGYLLKCLFVQASFEVWDTLYRTRILAHLESFFILLLVLFDYCTAKKEWSCMLARLPSLTRNSL